MPTPASPPPPNAVPNLDYDFYLQATAEHRDYQEDWLRTGYAPRGFYLKDFCLFKEEPGDGRAADSSGAAPLWHLFHIAGTPGVSCAVEGNEIWFGHATTRDFRHWTTHPPCLYIDPEGSWDSGHVFAPCVVRHGGLYWMFYTGCTRENTQRIGAATSPDLFHWRRVSPRPLIRPEEYPWAFCPTERGSACRDPHLARIGDTWRVYYTAVTKEGRGCVARADSDDLLHCRDGGVAYAFRGINHCESSNMQELDGQYLLFFGGHHEHWSYVLSSNPHTWPDQEPRPLKKGVTAMEVVEKRGRRWLVAYFKFATCRLFLGVIDWDAPVPTIEEISDGGALEAFGIGKARLPL